MAKFFDNKAFNGEVFGKYVETVSDLKRNELLKSGVLRPRSDIKAMFPAQTGGNYAMIPLKAPIDGDALNYDGATNITATSRKSFAQGMIVVGRAKGWTEKDFSSDITGGNNFLPIAGEVAHYWDNVDQDTLLSILKGVFSMTGVTANTAFVTNHTTDISAETSKNVVDATTLNTAIQKATGDNKSIFKVAIMHSVVATNLENLNLLGYMKYTDAAGIQRDLSLATWNGRLVLIDDNMPVEDVAESGSGTGDGYTKYTTYLLGDGAFDYADVGVTVPYEMDRNPATNGGETTLYSRQRKLFAPKGISYEPTTIPTSPTATQLEAGASWSLAHDGATSKSYYPHKAIPIARIISRG
nr:MAG TPA: major capsid protein [Caudoviricetes sp.]